MRLPVIAALGLAGCASSGAMLQVQADLRRLDAEARREAALRETICQRFEEYQRAHGGVTHPCRPTCATVDIQPLRVFGETR